MGGQISLKSFLADFERYFYSKYSGSERDCCRELGRYIEGEVKDAYLAIGGPQVKYSIMKQKLTEWYKSQRVGKSYLRKSEFTKATMREGETFKLYCMRLKDLAYRAYPHDSKEQFRELKKKLLITVPSWFARCIEKKEEMKRMIGIGQRVCWNDIVEVAEMQDKKIKKKNLIAGELDRITGGMSALVVSANNPNYVPDPAHIDVSLRGAQGNSQQPMKWVSPENCDYCGRFGHREVSCPVRRAVCYACGQTGHFSVDCPSLMWKCPTCAGPHLGKNCPNNAPSTNQVPPQPPIVGNRSGFDQSRGHDRGRGLPGGRNFGRGRGRSGRGAAVFVGARPKEGSRVNHPEGSPVLQQSKGTNDYSKPVLNSSWGGGRSSLESSDTWGIAATKTGGGGHDLMEFDSSEN